MAEGIKDDRLKLALVCMPFASVATPSIQVGLLAAIASDAGFQVDSYHFNLDLAASLGTSFYEELCNHRGQLTGEWLFSLAAFDGEAPDSCGGFLSEFPREREWFKQQLGPDYAGSIEILRNKTLPEFLDRCLESVDWANYKLVGFTSTFQQNVASLALAKKIKSRWPNVTIVFGGANMEDAMGAEYVRAFPFIDYAVVGEGDHVFPALLKSIAAGEQPEPVGLVYRASGEIRFGGQAPRVRNLNDLPIPSYEDFFSRADLLGLRRAERLPFESSRGCWWGHNHHCTFCGLNGLGMPYRMKKPGRIREELDELSRRHRIVSFDATDNIMAPKHIEGLFGTLADEPLDYEFFFEVKADLTREQIRGMRQGGVRRVQPGIESMSTHILGLMKKGTSILDNICALKWFGYYGIRVSWNLLCGFPGERTSDYEAQLSVLKLLGHLEPPSGLSRIWLERFSPYFTRRQDYPISDITPEASYGFVYPGGVDLEKIAYFFSYSMGDVVSGQVLSDTEDLITSWRNDWNSEGTKRRLTYRRAADALIVTDERSSQSRVNYIFDGPLGMLFQRCSDAPQDLQALTDSLSDRFGRRSNFRSEIRGALDEFVQAGLMVSEGEKYLNLAVPHHADFLRDRSCSNSS